MEFQRLGLLMFENQRVVKISIRRRLEFSCRGYLLSFKILIMKKVFILLLAICYIFLMSCDNQGKQTNKEVSKNKSEQHAHDSHDDHSHDSHDDRDHDSHDDRDHDSHDDHDHDSHDDHDHDSHDDHSHDSHDDHAHDSHDDHAHDSHDDHAHDSHDDHAHDSHDDHAHDSHDDHDHDSHDDHAHDSHDDHAHDSHDDHAHDSHDDHAHDSDDDHAHEAGDGHDHGDDEHLHGNSNNEEALKDFISRELVKTKKIYPETFNALIKTSGRLEPLANSTVKLSAVSSGIVQFDRKNLIFGSSVQQGDVLFTIIPKGIENNSVIKFEAAKEDYLLNKQQFERAEKLFEEKIIALKEYEQAQANFRLSEKTYNTFKKEFSSKGSNIVAPARGFVEELLVSEGEYVSEGQVIATVRKNGKIIVKADLPTSKAKFFQSIDDAVIRTSGGKTYRISELDGKRMNASLRSLDNNFLPVYFSIDQPEGLYVGDFIETGLYVGEKQNCLVVPNAAIMEDQGRYYVFVRHGATDFHKMYVDLGASDGRNTEILSGIQFGDIIVSEGATIVKLATQSSNMPASTHSH